MYLLIGILAFICPLSVTCCIEKYYSAVSGYELDGGMPSVAWITMGTIEDCSKPGWFNNYCVPNYYASNCSRELTAEVAIERLKLQLEYFKENPAYAISFYKRKICTQWNDPFFNTEYMIKVDEDMEVTGLSRLVQDNEERVLSMLSILQSLIYLGVLSYLIFESYKNEFANTLPEMIILGGFLFSIMWEANSRYVFSWYLIMFPLAAVGWYRCARHLANLRLLRRNL